MGELSWDEEFPGYDTEIASGMGLSEPLFLSDVTLKKFRFRSHRRRQRER